jgi:Glycine zipper
MTTSIIAALRRPFALFRGSYVRKSLIAALLGAVLLLAGCSGAPLTTREKGTLAGGAIGAGAGALVGSAAGAPGAGAAIGGVLGAGGGYVVGNHLQNEQYRHDYYSGY